MHAEDASRRFLNLVIESEIWTTKSGTQKRGITEPNFVIANGSQQAKFQLVRTTYLTSRRRSNHWLNHSPGNLGLPRSDEAPGTTKVEEIGAEISMTCVNPAAPSSKASFAVSTSAPALTIMGTDARGRGAANFDACGMDRVSAVTKNYRCNTPTK